MIAIIDYKAGNIGSIQNALDRLGATCCITADPVEIKAADGIIFPGQGRAGQAMGELRGSGLDKLIANLSQPFLGICLGMQLLAEFSEENDTQCLGIIPGICRRFPANLKTPQLGWNKVDFIKDSVMTKNIKSGEYFYFLNSYYFDTKEQYVRGTTGYGFDFPSVVQKDNFFAVQFHPEKSGKPGEQLLKNFCEVSKCL
jgi:glutamine amidotransferase